VDIPLFGAVHQPLTYGIVVTRDYLHGVVAATTLAFGEHSGGQRLIFHRLWDGLMTSIQGESLGRGTLKNIGNYG